MGGQQRNRAIHLGADQLVPHTGPQTRAAGHQPTEPPRPSAQIHVGAARFATTPVARPRQSGRDPDSALRAGDLAGVLALAVRALHVADGRRGRHRRDVDGDGVNHSCLHWGFYTPQDTDKHRVVATPVHDMQQGRPVRFEFAWWQHDQNQGRMVWWIDGRPVMKAPIPSGTRPMADFVVLLNIAMGGNVCQGQMPREGSYDMVVHELKMFDEPENGGWQKFEMDWARVREGDRI